MTVHTWSPCYKPELQQQHQQPQQNFYVPSITQPYDTRTVTANPLQRHPVIPQYLHTAYNGPVSTVQPVLATHVPVRQQQNAYYFGVYPEIHYNSVGPVYANSYLQRHPLPVTSCEVVSERNVPYVRNVHQGFVEEIHPQSPPAKAESEWAMPSISPTLTNTSLSATSSSSLRTVSNTVKVEPPEFNTGIDILMKTIQAKEKKSEPETSSPLLSSIPEAPISCTYDEQSSSGPHIIINSGKFMPMRHKKLSQNHGKNIKDTTSDEQAKRRHKCDKYYPDGSRCMKGFSQKTHLVIHYRSHTGERPFQCKMDNCGSCFSQKGNLRTHERRHTKIRPYACEICGKRFAQKGNVTSHLSTHSGIKPFNCRMSDSGKPECGKLFTQLGNLKCHMNRFHMHSIQYLNAKFHDDEKELTVHELDIWKYLANLFKNSNKGIKGRGRNNRVGDRRASSQRPVHVTSAPRSYSTASYPPGPAYDIVINHSIQRGEIGYESWGANGRELPMSGNLSSQSSEGSVGTIEYDMQVEYQQEQQHHNQQLANHQQHFNGQRY